jgi:hypothetical protein
MAASSRLSIRILKSALAQSIGSEINHQRGITDMADADFVKFTKELEKLCVTCGKDVKQLLTSCNSSIASRMGKLMDEMKKISVPNSAQADLDKVPQLVNAILKRESSKFAGLCTMNASIEIDK